VDSNGTGPSQWPVDALVLDVQVVEVPPALRVISEVEVPNTDSSVSGLLFKTANSFRNLWDKAQFEGEYCALNEKAAEVIVQRPSIKAIGIDYLSIQSPEATNAVHQDLLGHSVAVIEGLDLRPVSEGIFEMVCLPVLIKDIEAAPCRVMLKAKSRESAVADREVKSA
jgi:arylformamidase